MPKYVLTKINIYDKLNFLELKNRDELIYDLIFSDTLEYEIHIEEYISDIYKYDRFIDDTKDILKKSKVGILKEKITVETDSVIWKIKVSK